MSTKRVWLAICIACGTVLVVAFFGSPVLDPPAPVSHVVTAAPAPIITWEYDQVQPAIAYSSATNQYLAVWEDHHWGWGNRLGHQDCTTSH
ncbi:MAG: hypothetical protein FJ026_13700 [Chloroflexi bacterium]|nr:hypothetical protein [Chloroflexota bacterium]